MCVDIACVLFIHIDNRNKSTWKKCSKYILEVYSCCYRPLNKYRVPLSYKLPSIFSVISLFIDSLQLSLPEVLLFWMKLFIKSRSSPIIGQEKKWMPPLLIRPRTKINSAAATNPLFVCCSISHMPPLLICRNLFCSK